jgi:hypothetical protein
MKKKDVRRGVLSNQAYPIGELEMLYFNDPTI